MHLVARMSNAYLVPTQRFLSYLPRKRAVEVVTGCIDIPPRADDFAIPPPLRVLYAGKIEREHGIVQFVEVLETLDVTPAAARLEADISGAGPMSDWVAGRLGRLTRIEARQHGFVTSAQYALLGQTYKSQCGPGGALCGVQDTIEDLRVPRRQSGRRGRGHQ